MSESEEELIQNASEMDPSTVSSLERDLNRADTALSNLTDDEFWAVFENITEEGIVVDDRSEARVEMVGKATVFDEIEKETGEQVNDVINR